VIDAKSHSETYSLDLILRAASYASRMHEGQKRKYTGEPYILHCLEVARLVASAGGTPAMIAAALLHDAVEDTAATIEEIGQLFGFEVAELVAWVTDVSKPEDGNRAHRKTLDRDHIAQASAQAKTIKLADIISNTATITEQGTSFARYYLKEKQLLLNVLSEGSPPLMARAKAQIEAGLERLEPGPRESRDETKDG
jgi:(p)ppGpp synthase/HD superfamily hydrolase